MYKAIQGEVKNTSKKVNRLLVKNPTKYDKTKEFAHAFLRTITPLRYFLLVLGQLPFPIKDKSNQARKFTGGWLYPYNEAYLVFFCLSVFHFCALFIGLCTMLVPYEIIVDPTIIYVKQENVSALGTTISAPKDWEIEVIRKNFSPIVIIGLWYLYFMYTNVSVFMRRRAFLDYMNYWMFSFQLMQMEIDKTIRKKLLVELTVLVSASIAIPFLIVTKHGEGIVDVMDILSHIYLRPFHSKTILDPPLQMPLEVKNHERGTSPFYLYKIPGLFIMISGLIGARVGVIHFSMYTRLLTCVSKAWNQRLREGFIQHDLTKADGSKNRRVRVDLKFLLQDHFTIVQLYKMTDDLFGSQLAIYYVTASVTMIFELYNIVSVYSSEIVIDKRYPIQDPDRQAIARQLTLRRLDLPMTDELHELALREFFLGVLMFFISCLYIYQPANCANDAYNAGMEGFQTLRRHCYLGKCDTTQERNFVHTLVVSFAPNNPTILTASGYFDITRSLFPAVLSQVFGLLVAVYTLKPDAAEMWDFGQYANLCRRKDVLPSIKNKYCQELTGSYP